LKDAQTKLDGIKADIVKFRNENAGRLPDNAGGLQSQLVVIDTRISSADDKINNLQLSKRNLEDTKQEAEDMLALFSTGVEQNAPSEERVNQELAAMDRQIEAENATLAQLRQKYVETFPIVRDEVGKIETLKKQRAEMAKQDEQNRETDQKKLAEKADAVKQKMSLQQTATVTQQQDRIKQIQTQIENYDSEIQRAQQSKLDLEKQRIEVQARISSSPEIEQQYDQLMEQQRLATSQFDELSRKETDSETTQDIEERHLGEQLELLDPAQLPQNPVEPNRWIISSAGIAMGLLLGLVMAGAKEAKDTSLKNLKDVRAYTNLPVLTSVPLLENALLVRRKRRLFWLAWSAAILAGSAAMFVAMMYYMTGRGQ
jgi:uncharacterized protein involved in exopolysaccharide biosynthesis